MIKHENKFCQRCKAGFECKLGSISICQCSTVVLTEHERNYIAECFSDCLCAKCMKELKSEFHLQAFKNKIRKIIGWR